VWNSQLDGVVEIKINEKTYRGRYSVRGGIVQVTFGAASKQERLHGMAPKERAAVLLGDLVRAEAGK
jgi:hypothetical protein